MKVLVLIKKALIFLSLIFFIYGCEKPVFYSSWAGDKISIDGRYQDWNDFSPAYYDEKTKTSLYLANGHDFLYLCLITRNREIEAQVMGRGMVSWFDAEDKQRQVFGVSFPAGGMFLGEEKRGEDVNWRDQQDTGGLIDREKERLLDKDFNRRLETAEELADRFEIIERPADYQAKEKHPRNRSRKGEKGLFPEDLLKDKPLELSSQEANELGFAAKVGRENDYFVYELKVPLSKTPQYPHAIGVKPGRPIAIGLTIEGRGPSAKQGMFETSDIFQFWMTVILSPQA
ncbi:MAG: hypothetical protein PHT31_02065 [Candidatus Omnitrophica bacterium]|nr:hypothetical protein [Candidatus Omnitrophota bacterium]MDD5652933.1 hypothetical protein [Candidatus Omnitrophota bacterium]